jgi:hypothetical protein
VTRGGTLNGITMRLLLLAHRYLGIAVGLLMVMWCLSGVIMMYVSYPALRESVRLQHLAPLDWRACCKISEALSQAASGDLQASVGNSQVEMLSGRPVLHLGPPSGSRPIDLRSGTAVSPISVEQATAVAQAFSGPGEDAPRLLGLIDHDQWTVSGDFNADRPLFHVALQDAKRTEVYVSSITGRAVQITTAHERFWNWLGAVPHWLYFSELRRNASLWSQVVIYTSLLGCFLTGIGICLGVRQLAAQPAGRWSPYRGFNLWHHLAGLIFGIFTLSWVLSGLLSMNPWGWLEGGGTQSEAIRLQGRPDTSLAQFSAALHAFAGQLETAPADPASAQASPVVQSPPVLLQAAPLDGKLFFVAVTAQGQRQRFDAAAQSSPLAGADLGFLARSLSGSEPPGTIELMAVEDNLYFSHHRDVVTLPVYRMTMTGSGTRYYVDSVSGMLIAKLDANAQAYRWLHEGLHRLDVTQWLRTRPQWDVFMLTLMAGVTVLCMTGAYLGCRRLLR